MKVRIVTNIFVGAAISLAAAAGAARAQEHHDHDPDAPHDAALRHLAHSEMHGGFPAFVDIFFTHHAYLERKLHPRLDATLADETREYAGSAELVWRFGQRLGIEIAGGMVHTEPEIGEGASGFADVEVAPMLALLQDPERLLIVSVRSGFVLPTGDEEEGLGIDGWGWEPAVLVWKGFGPQKRAALQAELGYERVFADEGPDEEALVASLGLSYWLPSNWIPVLELTGTTPLGDEPSEHHEEEALDAGRGLQPAHGETIESEDTLVSATLGFRYAFANGQQWGAGIQFPVSDSEAYDARLVVGGIIHVE